jgi:hypothetical protein
MLEIALNELAEGDRAIRSKLLALKSFAVSG